MSHNANRFGQLTLALVALMLLSATIACASLRSPDEPAPTRAVTPNIAPTEAPSPTALPPFRFGG